VELRFANAKKSMQRKDLPVVLPQKFPRNLLDFLVRFVSRQK